MEKDKVKPDKKDVQIITASLGILDGALNMSVNKTKQKVKHAKEK